MASLIDFSAATCTDLEAASRREWLETNGLGGFACGTVAGLHTRRYHGLLTAALHPPVGRHVLLSKLEETLVLNGRRFELSANRYSPDVIHPAGYQYLRRFRLDPFPVFHFVVEDVEIEKSLFMVHGQNTTVVQYLVRAASADSVRLEVRPLIAFRDYHATTHENGALNPAVETGANWLSVTPYSGLPSLYLAHDTAEVDRAGYWYRNFEYAVERERGLDAVEDLYSPFGLSFSLNGRNQVSLIASTEPHEIGEAGPYRQAEIARRNAVLAKSFSDDELVAALTAAADQFLAARGDGQTILAGYPWFSDWGRDTMIALPGLALATGRQDAAKSILREFARHVDRGMLPNRFPDAGEAPEYNTVDAALWFFEAARAVNDPEFVQQELYAVLESIVEWHVRGTRYGIRMDDDGLLVAGEAGVQLTWMDAKIGDWVVTPRHGKPVEIQALWYNALRIMERFARSFGDPAAADRYGERAVLARRGFQRLFWNEDRGCLYDVVSDGGPDASVRPNQILALSLTYTMLGAEKSRRVLETVERELLTPYGLRSLSPSDPRYQGRYTGGPWERDAAYHQGTVWAWLMGPFLSAYVRVHGEPGRVQAREWLNGFRAHLTDAGLGQVSEIFDGDFPFCPRGCIAQAWSVAELLRTAMEDVVGTPAGFREFTGFEENAARSPESFAAHS
ncbi:MAG: glycogen debranching enzyme family protein [Candidatus Solibacter usitatus]|nr:glycogen debranching enzyme family protein [Candidatus Solibacter usitatus]